LPGGYRLHWYVLDRVLGQGGFGITYLARDTNLDRQVAIKEYLPSEIARRRSDASAHPRTESQSERYTWGLDRFLTEARTLARFDHPNIVRVHSVFESNNTAYMVMRFEEGESLAALLGRSGMQTERQLTHWLMPILDGLELVHAAGYIHRDIKPDNIYLRADGSPVLLDFGSARQAFGSSKTMTILVAPGYAPLEQYYGDASTQGAWTDIYGLAATCYRAIAGRAPLDAVARAKGVLGSAREVLAPAVEAGRGRFTESLLVAVDQALRLSESDRPQSVADWRRALVASASAATLPVVPITVAEPAAEPMVAPVAALAAAVPAASVSTVTAAPVQAATDTGRRAHWLWAGTAGVLGASVAAGVVVWLLRANPPAVERVLPEVIASAPASAPASVPSAGAAIPPEPAPSAAVAEASKEATKAPRAAEPKIAAKPSADIPLKLQPQAPPPKGKAPILPSPDAGTPVAKAMPPPSEVRSEPIVTPVPASAPAPIPTVTAAVSAPVPAPVHRPEPVARPAGAAQIEAAELALRNGDAAAAVQIVTPWAWAGVPRAQVVLGQARALRSGQQQSPFEAYVWLRLAERGGEPEAHALSDKVAVRLQPADIRQAEAIVQSWKPRPAPTAGTSP
jgi:hypothetical protein